MKKSLNTLDLLLRKISKEDLIEVLPDIQNAIADLVIEIRNSPDSESAKNFLDLLEVFLAPLSSLSYKHDFKLPEPLMEVLRQEGNIVNRGYNPVSMQNLFNAIKNKQVFDWK